MTHTSNCQDRRVWNRFAATAPKMKCVEDQIKDNMSFGQGVTEWAEMDWEGVGGRKERDGGGWRKAQVRLQWGWRCDRARSHEAGRGGWKVGRIREVSVVDNAVRVGAKYRPGSMRVGRQSRCLELVSRWILASLIQTFSFFHIQTLYVKKSVKLQNDPFI